MHEAAQHEGRPGTPVAGIEERGDGGAAGLEGEVMDGADGLVGHDRGGVVHETRRGRIEATAQGDDGREAHRSVGILRHRIESGGGAAHPVEGVGTRMAQHRIGVGVLPEHRQHLGQVLIRAEAGGGQGGEGAHARRRVEDELAEREFVPVQRGLRKRAGGLGADLGVGMGEQRHETVRGGDAGGERCDRSGLAIESFARGDRGAATGENAETPDAVDAFERVGRLRRGLETVGGVRAAGELDLGAQADALVGVREQRRELGGTALGKTFLHQGGHRGGRLGLHHLVGRKRDDAAGVVGLPARDEVGHHQTTLPVVFDVGGGDAPDQLVRLHHLHARAGGLELEGPDTGTAGGAAVIADVEVLGLGLEVARAGVVGEARRTRRDVGGRRDDEGRLDGVLELPDLLGHPAGGRTLLQTDRAVERVHGLVLHLPAGIRALDDVDDARLVALVGVIVDRDAVAELVEGDLLRVTQAEVHDLEVRAVRLEAEHGAPVAGVVLLAFLGREVETAIADRAPDAAVVPDGEAVHVVAGERDAHAEAVL